MVPLLTIGEYKWRRKLFLMEKMERIISGEEQVLINQHYVTKFFFPETLISHRIKFF